MPRLPISLTRRAELYAANRACHAILFQFMQPLFDFSRRDNTMKIYLWRHLNQEKFARSPRKNAFRCTVTWTNRWEFSHWHKTVLTTDSPHSQLPMHCSSHVSWRHVLLPSSYPKGMMQKKINDWRPTQPYLRFDQLVPAVLRRLWRNSRTSLHRFPYSSNDAPYQEGNIGKPWLNVRSVRQVDIMKVRYLVNVIALGWMSVQPFPSSPLCFRRVRWKPDAFDILWVYVRRIESLDDGPAQDAHSNVGKCQKESSCWINK